MAKSNKLVVAINFIESEIENAKKQINIESSTGHYEKAGGWQAYIAGLEKTLSYIHVLLNSSENKK